MKIILAGICKNIETTLPIIKEGFNELSEKFELCKGVFYENNSTDNTPELLTQWKKENQNIDFISEKIDNDVLLEICKARTWDNLPCRIEIIARARNKLMCLLEKDIYNDYDYVILIDMDNKYSLPISKIVNVIEKYGPDFDALICKGIQSNNFIYDTYAYRDINNIFGPEILGENWWSYENQAKMKLSANNYNQNTSIFSGFNGMAILKKASIFGIRYSGVVNREVDNFYQLTLKNNPKCILAEQSKNANNNVINGVLNNIYLFGRDGIFYKNNSGYNFPIICEHIPFFLSMREKNFDKIYFCPELVWNWN